MTRVVLLLGHSDDEQSGDSAFDSNNVADVKLYVIVLIWSDQYSVFICSGACMYQLL